MKRFNLICGFLLLQCYTSESSPECITITQLNRATEVLCRDHRHNKTLWNSVIKCHRPISDKFLRSSNEALCPNPKQVQDPTDNTYSIEEVFFNICGVVYGTRLQIIAAEACLISGHKAEVKEVKRRWGTDLPCNIGKCIKRLGLNLDI